MKISNTIPLLLLFIFFFSSFANAQKAPEERMLEADDDLYISLLLNHEAAAIELKKNNGAVNLSLGFGSLVRISDLDLFNRRRNEMGNINFLYYISNEYGMSTFAGAGYFIKGSLFGKEDEKYNNLMPGTNAYLIAGQKINFRVSFFGEMSLRINDKLSPTIFLGYQF